MKTRSQEMFDTFLCKYATCLDNQVWADLRKVQEMVDDDIEEGQFLLQESQDEVKDLEEQVDRLESISGDDLDTVEGLREELRQGEAANATLQKAVGVLTDQFLKEMGVV